MDKVQQLEGSLLSLGSVAIAFSSGVDSTYLLKVAHDLLQDRAIAITVTAPFFPQRELEEARDFCQKEKIKQSIIAIDLDDIEHFKENPKDRCYWCKRTLFKKIKQEAKRQGIDHVLEGSNQDDLSDYRPGLKALEELHILSPLLELGFTKPEIREASEKLHLPTYNKPSMACLATRFVYGQKITIDKLKRVEEAEQLLFDLGVKQGRVRVHDNLARIEVNNEDLRIIIDHKDLIDASFKNKGFDYVCVDLHGYQSGSMNIGM